MSNKISVITVVYNDAKNIRQTMESFFSQTWEEKEYIIVDGGSTDGTAEIIKEYADRLAWWCSEKDKGIYDAMNKGIQHATGDWINILNCGDSYCSTESLKEAMTNCDPESADIIYGDSMVNKDGSLFFFPASNDVSQLNYSPIYRHGSSFVRTKIHKKHLFDLSKSKKYGFALDWLLIYTLYKNGYRFARTNAFIEVFDIEGVSNKPLKGAILNYRISTSDGFSLKKAFEFAKAFSKVCFVNSIFYSTLRHFALETFANTILSHLP